MVVRVVTFFILEVPDSDRAALVSGINYKWPMRYHGKFQCVVLLKFCRSFVSVLKIRNSNSEFFESFIRVKRPLLARLRNLRTLNAN